jgi:hypothetical protein
MKLSKFFLIAVLVGPVAMIGCGDDDNGGGTAGTGGSGTAGSGGSGTGGTGGGGTGTDFCAEQCDSTNPSAITDCENTYTTCIAEDPGGNVEEKCRTAGLLRCDIV